mmetsp:Transcript_25845/g.60854  ORF Transcript_25845/g.60854 Transcript_25845/m.60854 type:complete len:552 (-) Transcript_25845:2612-4267(-)
MPRNAMLNLAHRLPSACRLSVNGSDAEESNSCADPFSEKIVVDNNYGSRGVTECDSMDATTGDRMGKSAIVTHVIVLIHGWMGNPAEMGYISESIQNAASKVGASGDGSVHHKFVIYSLECNEHRTDDGFAVGGSRVAKEINDLVRHVVFDGTSSTTNDTESDGDKERPIAFATLSIVGNSLGGLYARHALAGIEWSIVDESSASPPIDLRPMVFVTTATPHLGISQHTYIPIPRAAEFVAAQAMKETGRDLFRFTHVLEDMFYKDYFINPLAKFKQRIAYINVYGTDFQVPTATAAFWAPGSDSVHYRVPNYSELSESESSDGAVSDSKPNEPSSVPKAIVMTLSTPQRLDLLNEEEEDKSEEANANEENKDGKAQGNKNQTELYRSWSKRLDRLGWTKVLVDVREDVPVVPVPVKSQDESSVDEKKDEGAADTNEDVTDVKKSETDTTVAEEDLDDTSADLNLKNTWTAEELLAEFKGGLLIAGANTKKRRGSLWDLKPRLPLGHAVMIANAKDEFNRKVTRGGKPVMDYLGVSMVRTLTSEIYTTDQR